MLLYRATTNSLAYRTTTGATVYPGTTQQESARLLAQAGWGSTQDAEPMSIKTTPGDETPGTTDEPYLSRSAHSADKSRLSLGEKDGR